MQFLPIFFYINEGEGASKLWRPFEMGFKILGQVVKRGGGPKVPKIVWRPLWMAPKLA